MDVVDRLYSGYGEGAPSGHGPSQGLITREGKAYLDKDFPLLSVVTVASCIGARAPHWRPRSVTRRSASRNAF